MIPYSQNIHRRRFPEKQQHPLCRNLGCVKKQRNFCAHATRQHRRNEWAQCSPCSSLPSQTLKPPCGASSAGGRRAVGDTRWRRRATSFSAEIAAPCSRPHRLCPHRDVKSIIRLHTRHHPRPPLITKKTSFCAGVIFFYI